MKNNQIVKLAKSSNKKIGKYFDVSEGAVRAWNRDNPEQYKNNLREYKNNTQPFISVEDFAIENDMDVSEIIKHIDLNDIPSILVEDKENNKLVPYIPYSMMRIFEMRKELENLKKAQVITLANKKGGVGKTTTTVSFASTLAYLGFKVLIIDADTQANTTAMFDIYMNNGYEKTIVDVLYEVAKSAKKDPKKITHSAIVDVTEKLGFIGKLHILPNSGTIENEEKFENLESELKRECNINLILDDVVESVKDEYDFIVIDTPPRVDLTLRISAMASDYIIMVFTAEKMSKDGIPSFLGPLANFNNAYYKHKKKDINVLGGIMNAYLKQINLQMTFSEEIEDDLNDVLQRSDFDTTSNYLEQGSSNLFSTKIRHSTKIQYIQLNGQGSFLSKSSLEEGIDEQSADTIRDYFTLTEEILNRIFINLYNTEVLK
ncbi:MAG: ParA family protein [Arcobacteraceae bacterium]